MKLPTPFSENLARLRKAAGLTQAQLAGRANLITSRVGAFESGRRVPSAQEVSVIANALNVVAESLTRDTDWVERAAPSLDAEASRSLRSTPPDIVTGQLPFQKHLDSAYRLNPRLLRFFESQIEKRPNSMALKCFLRDTWADSGVEAMWWTNLCSAETHPVRLPLLPHGLREHQALCPVTRMPVGDIARAGLWLPGATPAVFFPQITIATAKRPIRIDCMTCFGKNRWVALEIDGDGHKSRWDELRDAELAYPVWRWNTSDVQQIDLLTQIRRRFKSAFAH